MTSYRGLLKVRTFPNQKPWVNGEVRAKLKARTDAYNSGDLEEYRKSRYALRRAISSAKRQYRDKVESHYKGSNTRSMWTGLKTLTDYKKKISSAEAPGPDRHPRPKLSRTHWTHFSLPTGPIGQTEDAIALTLHTALSHLDQRDTYVRMLFIDYSSAFNTIVPSKLVTKLRDLGLNSALCDWILNFLTRQTPGCADGQHHILHPDSEHRRPPGLCAQPSAVLTLFMMTAWPPTAPTPSSNLLTTRPSIGLITGDDLSRDGLQRGGQSPDILVPGQQPPSQRQQN
ncbi:hypothetical protein L3Q82_012850 [Scortum barcoo]|uniref:Uncharacterized protein n=1 Tax=Scortum barcoo TaxID=214431 RepID=A0ACB8VYR6_9TELE|nr:hypothetical protein L3Q82_012850 [Scortum barcoo]